MGAICLVCLQTFGVDFMDPKYTDKFVVHVIVIDQWNKTAR